MQGKKRWQVHRRMTQDLRQWWAQERLPHPRPSFISDARKLYALWPDVFHARTKNVSYDDYRQMAVCSLPRDQKDELRTWAETQQPRREELRQRSGTE